MLGKDRTELVEAAVLSGNDTDSEVLISLDLLIAWDLVPEGFPNITLNAYFTQLMTNKHFSKNYSSLYSQHSKTFENQLSDDISENQYKIPETSKDCQKLRDKIMKKHSGLFKEKLSPQARINAPQIRLKLDPTKNVTPRAHSRPYDVPYNIREAMNNELSDAIEAGVLTPCSESSE